MKRECCIGNKPKGIGASEALEAKRKLVQGKLVR